MVLPLRPGPCWTLLPRHRSFVNVWPNTCISLVLVDWYKLLVSVAYHTTRLQSVVNFKVSPEWCVDGETLKVEAIVPPKVTSDLPLHPVP